MHSHWQARKIALVATSKLVGALAIFCSTASFADQEKTESGWWIVIASFRNDGSARNDSSIRSASRQVAPCGVVSFNDLSMKFQGFESGYDVVVVGPYPARSNADRYLEKVRACVPKAYLKAGTYLGE